MEGEVEGNLGRTPHVAREERCPGFTRAGKQRIDQVVDFLVVRDIRDDGCRVGELRFAVAGILFKDCLDGGLCRGAHFLGLAQVAIPEGRIDVGEVAFDFLDFFLVCRIRDFFAAGGDFDLGFDGVVNRDWILFRICRRGTAVIGGTPCQVCQSAESDNGGLFEKFHFVLPFLVCKEK